MLIDNENFVLFLLHFFQEVSGLPTTVKKETTEAAASPDPMGESSSSGPARLEKAESFQAM